MDKVKTEKIRCLNPSCKKWFNSPIAAGDMKSFDNLTMKSNKVQCPHCGRMTERNKENIRVAEADGGVRSNDTF